MERWIEMDQQIVFSFGAWGHPCALSSVAFCFVKRQIVKFHGGPSSDGGIGRHNIAGMVGGGGGFLGLMNKICRFLHQKSQCFGKKSNSFKKVMVLMQILFFFFEFLLVHWYFQQFFPMVDPGTTSLEPCQPHVTQGGNGVSGGFWTQVVGYWKEARPPKKVGVLIFEL